MVFLCSCVLTLGDGDGLCSMKRQEITPSFTWCGFGGRLGGLPVEADIQGAIVLVAE